MDFLHPLQGLVWVFGEVCPSAVTWSSPSHTEPLLGLAGEIGNRETAWYVHSTYADVDLWEKKKGLNNTRA